MKIDMIGCLHGAYPQTPGGDLLIITGDLTARDTLEEQIIFCDWILKQDYKKIIWISGNHDNKYLDLGGCYFFLSTDKRDKSHIKYLCDSGTEFEGLKIWGLPWSLNFPNINPKCTAFTCTEKEMEEHVAKIPLDTDIIISHSPPWGILDKTIRNKHVGSVELRNAVLNTKRFPNLKAVIFSHIHECGGRIFETPLTKFINCSIMNERYEAVNPVMSIEL